MKLKSVTIVIDEPKSVSIIQEAAKLVNVTPDTFVQYAVSTFAIKILKDKHYAAHIKELWNEATKKGE